ncbi:hypothetical protein HPB49_013074 [Dermacentor silvarum]|uniref:Uncharacterized protein n=1 Tax=Dermacentor silvarum TaxID=543639 RepID=A0ACB8E0R0_DERSI|nr:hypothetical protein HPB49_013074 [Dermacentor silvarum]
MPAKILLADGGLRSASEIITKLSCQVKQFALLINNVDFQPGGSWIQSFKERRGSVCKAVTSEGASLDVEAKQKWVQETLPRILENCVDANTHALKGDTYKGFKNSKLHFTVFLCVNMDGSDKCPAFVIGK